MVSISKGGLKSLKALPGPPAYYRLPDSGKGSGLRPVFFRHIPGPRFLGLFLYFIQDFIGRRILSIF